MDKKFGNYYNRPEVTTVTTKTGTCLENDSDRNQSGFNQSAHKW